MPTEVDDKIIDTLVMVFAAWLELLNFFKQSIVTPCIKK